MFLDDITVSREHAVLERRPDGLQLTDLGQPERHLREPRSGSRPSRLADGDELQIGKYRLTYIEQELTCQPIRHRPPLAPHG